MVRKALLTLVMFLLIVLMLTVGLTAPTVEAQGTNWAILISGGYNRDKNHARYWNDLSEMYEILTDTYGYEPNAVFVLYADGNPPTAENCYDPSHVDASYSTNIIDYSATAANLKTVCEHIATNGDPSDTLFVFTTDHGETSDGHSTLVLWGDEIRDDTFAGATYIGRITQYTWRAFVIEQCYSGGFVNDLSGPRTVIVTACTASEHSFAMFPHPPEPYYDEFCYHFNAALKGETPDGTAVDADADDNGRVSFMEAFNYAISNDKFAPPGFTYQGVTYTETPQYDDNGDGISHTGQMPSGGDGCLGSLTFLGQSHTTIDRGLVWLCNQQNPDGSWTYSGRVTEENVGLTAMATLAFLNHGIDENDPTVRKAIDWILSKQQADGKITNGWYHNYDTSLAVLALVATRNESYYDEIRKAVSFLIKLQNDEDEGYTQDSPYYGGWPYWKWMWDWADLSNSQFTMLALHYAEQFNLDDDIVPEEVWDKAEIFVTRCQNREASNPNYNFYDDGGFIYQPSSTIWAGGQSYASVTMAGLWGLYTCGVSGTDGRVQDAWNWIKNNYYVNQNYPLGEKFLYYYLYGLAKACMLWNVETINGHIWYSEMVDELINRQQEDGHWPGTDWSEEPDNVATCWALLGLESKLVPTGTDIEIRVDSPADLHVYDPEGRHVGINYDTGEVEIEIPGATYSGPSSEPQVIHIPDPIGGSYKIKLVGIETGDYTLTIKGFIGENEISTVSYTGSINPGQVYESTAIVSAIAGALTIDTTEPELIVIQGDFDNDGDVDQNDLNILLTYRNQPASACPECDIDGNGIITVLDARKLVLMCTRPRCATE